MTVTDRDRPDLGGNLHHGDDATYCPQLWTYLVRRFAVRSILDVGCGEGHAVSWFNRSGVYAVGIDGLWSNVDRAVHPIVRHDLAEGPFVMPVDLVWCCEVAEHLDANMIAQFMQTLANGRIIAMTHALPGQGGYHHVNEQPADYWVSRICSMGYELASCTSLCRRFDSWPTYFARSGLVFVKAQ